MPAAASADTATSVGDGPEPDAATAVAGGADAVSAVGAVELQEASTRADAVNRIRERRMKSPDIDDASIRREIRA